MLLSKANENLPRTTRETIRTPETLLPAIFTTSNSLTSPISDTTTTTTNPIIHNKLVKIPLSDLPKLRDLYNTVTLHCYNSSSCNGNNVVNNCYTNCCWPLQNHIGYQTITNYIKWIKNEFNTVTILTRKGTPITTGDNLTNFVDFNDAGELNLFNDIDNDDDKDRNYRLEYNQQQNYFSDSTVLSDYHDVEKIFEIYSLNGDWKTDGLFVIIDNHQIIFNMLYGFKTDRLLTALNLLRLKKNGSLNILNGFSDRFLMSVKNYMNKNDYRMNHCMNITTLWYYLSKHEAKRFQISLPNNLHLESLTEDHAKIINDYWSWKHKGSEDLIKRLIRCNENIGAFDLNGNLVAWCLRQQVGALGVLYVMDSHRKKGIGKVIVQKMAKIIANCRDEDVCATVVDTNSASKRLFESLGFKVIDRVNWFALEDFKEHSSTAINNI